MGFLDIATKAFNHFFGSDDKETKSVKKTETKEAQKSDKSQNKQEDKKTEKNNQNKKPKVNSVVSSSKKTMRIGDEVVIKQPKSSAVENETGNQIPVSKESQNFGKNKKSSVNIDAAIKKAKINIENNCKRFNICYKDIESTILKQMNFSYKQFEKMSKKEQLSVLLQIDGAIGMYIVDKKIYSIDASVNKAVLIGQTAKNIRQATKSGDEVSIKEFTNNVDKIANQMEHEVKLNSSDDEIKDILFESRKKIKASINIQRYDAIKRCNGNKEEIARINAEYDKKLEAFELELQNQFNARFGKEKAHLSVYACSGNIYGEAHKNALKVFNEDAKSKIANNWTHDFEIDAKRRYYEANEPISSEQYGIAIECATSYMEEAALEKFEKDSYEFRLKVEKGEIDAPYMTKDDFTAETKAIGFGILSNENLSDESRSKLMSQWNEHASKFSDYDEVADAIQEKIKDLKQTKKDEQSELERKDNNSDNASVSLNDKISDMIKETSIIKLVQEVGEKKANPLQLERALVYMSYEEARKLFSKNTEREFAEVVLHSSKLKNHRLHILSFLTTLNGKDLYNITQGCQTDMYLFVLRNITPDKAIDLHNAAKDEKGYVARNLGEHIVEEQQTAKKGQYYEAA